MRWGEETGEKKRSAPRSNELMMDGRAVEGKEGRLTTGKKKPLASGGEDRKERGMLPRCHYKARCSNSNRQCPCKHSYIMSPFWGILLETYHPPAVYVYKLKGNIDFELCVWVECLRVGEVVYVPDVNSVHDATFSRRMNRVRWTKHWGKKHQMNDFIGFRQWRGPVISAASATCRQCAAHRATIQDCRAKTSFNNLYAEPHAHIQGYERNWCNMSVLGNRMRLRWTLCSSYRASV